MKIMITGAAGMLGKDLAPVLASDEVVGVDITGDTIPLDITDLTAVQSFIRKHKPDTVIHCAAFTNVDGCQTNPEAAWKVNATGTWNLAAACQETDAALLTISTDFVFDGEKGTPYDEFDHPNPISIYGRSKYAGEVFTRQMVRKHYIVRTAWLYGALGRSFPGIMINAAKEGKTLKVVGDQTGSPTYTVDLAEAVSQIIRKPLYGIYHVTNSGECTWWDLARASLDEYGLADIPIANITSDEWPTPTKRPTYSVMEHRALMLAGIGPMRPWQDALKDFMLRYKEING